MKQSTFFIFCFPLFFIFYSAFAENDIFLL